MGSSVTEWIQTVSGATLPGCSPALSFISCVASDKLFTLSVPQFPQLQNEEDGSAVSTSKGS